MKLWKLSIVFLLISGTAGATNCNKDPDLCVDEITVQTCVGQNYFFQEREISHFPEGSVSRISRLTKLPTKEEISARGYRVTGNTLYFHNIAVERVECSLCRTDSLAPWQCSFGML